MTPSTLNFPTLYWLQSPSAPDGSLGIRVGRVRGGYVPYCISGKGDAVALPPLSLAVSQCFQETSGQAPLAQPLEYLGMHITTPWDLAICCGFKKGGQTSPLLTGTLPFYFVLDSAKYVAHPGVLANGREGWMELFQLIKHHPGRLRPFLSCQRRNKTFYSGVSEGAKQRLDQG